MKRFLAGLARGHGDRRRGGAVVAVVSFRGASPKPFR
jgi:hypothetical protein